MQISQYQNFNSYNNNLYKPKFGNQTTRGVTAKAVNALGEALEEDDFVRGGGGAFANKLHSAARKYLKISETRWEKGNRRYYGNDKEEM